MTSGHLSKARICILTGLVSLLLHYFDSTYLPSLQGYNNNHTLAAMPLPSYFGFCVCPKAPYWQTQFQQWDKGDPEALPNLRHICQNRNGKTIREGEATVVEEEDSNGIKRAYGVCHGGKILRLDCRIDPKRYMNQAN